MATNPRRGKGGHAYRRRAEALKQRTKANGDTCSNCGEPFDWNNHLSPRGFTADHPDPLKHGGSLLGQQLVPLCRGCNARKRDTITPTIRNAS